MSFKSSGESLIKIYQEITCEYKPLYTHLNNHNMIIICGKKENWIETCTVNQATQLRCNNLYYFKIDNPIL